jgi:hypothetical protein
MQVNSRDKHDFRGSDDLSCRANCSDYIVVLFLMMQDHEGPVAALYTPLGDVEEIFNPLGVSLGASES